MKPSKPFLKTIVWVITAVMLFSTVPFSAFAEQEAPDKSSGITTFEPPDESMTEQSASYITDIFKINLPNDLLEETEQLADIVALFPEMTEEEYEATQVELPMPMMEEEVLKEEHIRVMSTEFYGVYGSNGKFLAPIEAPAAGSIPISTRSQLEDINNNLSSNYYLTQDIDLSDIEWVPIGNSTNPFRGTFDGQGYVIRNLRITDESQAIGLFGYTFGATIKNVGLERDGMGTMIDITSSSSISAGGICRVLSFNSIIYNCYNTCDVSATTSAPIFTSITIGGICASLSNDSTISNCYNTGSVSASNTSTPLSNNASDSGVRIGGICGTTGGSISSIESIENCYNLGDVTVSNNLIFSNNSNNNTASSYAGGIVGYGASISNCYNIGDINASTSDISGYQPFSRSCAGGISGEGSSIINDCYNTGNVSASSSTSCTNPIDVTTTSSYAGGIIGEGYGSSISNCYNIGDMSSTVNNKPS